MPFLSFVNYLYNYNSNLHMDGIFFSINMYCFYFVLICSVGARGGFSVVLNFLQFFFSELKNQLCQTGTLSLD